MTPRRGFALLASVWLMVAIAAVGLEVAWLARMRRLAMLNALDETRARAGAIAGLEHARARLANALIPVANDALADPWRWAVGSDSADLGTARYTYRIRDDGTALDVNRATEPMLTRLFAACGADALAAMQGAQRLADWRDPDTARRTRGAERSDYLAMAARTLPADGPVQSVAELDDVAGLPVRPWACVWPLLQVGGSGRVNPNTAPIEVLAALPGFSLDAARSVAGARSSGTAMRNFGELVAAVPGALRGDILRNAADLHGVLVFQSELVRIASVGQVTGSPVQVRAEALMRRNGGTVFVEWQEFR